MNTQKPILIVDDDTVDAMTVKRALKDIKVMNRIDIANNGEEALHYLTDDSTEKPCIILLDLNMPKMNGIEFLKIIKENEHLRMIPVVVLTTSQEERDRAESFMNNAAGYMIKPVDYLQFVETVKTIDLYWSLSELPE